MRAGIFALLALAARYADGISGMRSPSRRLRAESDALRLADVVILDGDNIRGKTAWKWGTEELAGLTASWARGADVQGRVLLYFDHGNEADALWTPDGLAVAFSGPRASADDAICEAVRFLSRECSAVVTVVTADSELKERCGKSAQFRRHLLTVSPLALIAALQAQPQPAGTARSGLASDELSAAQPLTPQAVQVRQLAIELAAVRKALRRGTGQKKRSKLLSRRHQLEHKRWVQAAARLELPAEPAQSDLPSTDQPAAGCADGERAVVSLSEDAEANASASTFASASASTLSVAVVFVSLTGDTAGADTAAADSVGTLAPPPTDSTRFGVKELTSDRVRQAERFRRQLRAAGATLEPPDAVCARPALSALVALSARAQAGRVLVTNSASELTGRVQLTGRTREMVEAAAEARPPPREIGEDSRLLAFDIGRREGGFAIVHAKSGVVLAHAPLKWAPATRPVRGAGAEADESARETGWLIDTIPLALEAAAKSGGTIERVVIEGNSQMCDRWRQALGLQLAASRAEAGGARAPSGPKPASADVDVVCVSAQSWRAAMLTPRERKDKISSKEAARQIARQLLHRSGLQDDARQKLDTNVAEAICVAHWAHAYLWRDAGAQGATLAQDAAARMLVERTVAGGIRTV